MQVKILLFALLFSAPIWLVAQDEPSKSDLSPCGSVEPVSEWLRAYLANPTDFPDFSNDTLYVGTQIHLLARDNGTGRFAASRVLDAFCRLNEDFKPARIRFYAKNDWNNIDSTKWFTHTTIPQGIEMMLKNNKPDVLNAYFVSNPAGNCGYNLPYAGVAISHGCAGANDHTWAHEVGHALKLPHPFIGWEGKTYNFNTPTPTRLTYDYTYFHDTIDVVLGRLDTAIVEYVDGSNCAVAADKVCDSKPDYISQRWNCDAQGKSTTKQKDPNGVEFYSDGSLYMSYANDACQNRFTPLQIDIMRAHLQNKKSNWLSSAPPAAVPSGTAINVAPIDGELVNPANIKLVWNKVPNATHYIVQVSRFATFSTVEREFLVKDTSVIVTPQLTPNINFNWRVKAFNAWNACVPFSTVYKFKTNPLSNTNTLAESDFRYYPTQQAAGRNLTVELPEHWTGNRAFFSIYDATGKLMFEQDIFLAQSALQVPMPAAGLPTGAYFFTVKSKIGIKSGRIMY